MYHYVSFIAPFFSIKSSESNKIPKPLSHKNKFAKTYMRDALIFGLIYIHILGYRVFGLKNVVIDHS